MMMPPDIMFFVQQQRRREMLHEAEQARLLRATRPTPNGERTFQHFTWWVGGVLLAWGCALGQAGRATPATEKGCSLCLA
jgi:hypothetical protein